MRILMLSAHFNQAGDSIPIGGVQKHIEGLTKALRAKGHIIDWNYPSRISEKEIDENYDIVLCHDFFTYRWNCKIPKIIIFHGWEGKWPLNNVVVDKRRKIAENANAVINIGHSIPVMYESKKGDLIIYGGADIPEDFEEPIFDFRKSKKKMLIMARLKPDSFVVEGAKLAVLRGWNLEICGDGDQEIKDKIIEIKPDTIFHGWVKNVNLYVNNCDVLMIGGYLAMIEGMQQKKVIVGFYNSKGREFRLNYLPENVKIFHGWNAEEVNEQIQNNDIEKIIENNYKWARMQTWENIARLYIGVIEKCFQK